MPATFGYIVLRSKVDIKTFNRVVWDVMNEQE